jgi:hypothetical protein
VSIVFVDRAEVVMRVALAIVLVAIGWCVR